MPSPGEKGDREAVEEECGQLSNLYAMYQTCLELSNPNIKDIAGLYDFADRRIPARIPLQSRWLALTNQSSRQLLPGRSHFLCRDSLAEP